MCEEEDTCLLMCWCKGSRPTAGHGARGEQEHVVDTLLTTSKVLVDMTLDTSANKRQINGTSTAGHGANGEQKHVVKIEEFKTLQT